MHQRKWPGNRALSFAPKDVEVPISQTQSTLVKRGAEIKLVLLSVQSLSHVRLFVTPWAAAHQASLSFNISQFAQTHVHWVLDDIQPSHPWPPLLLPSIFCSIRVFSNESTLYIRWPKYWNFSFSISPSSEYSGLISFRMDWFDFLAVQGTFKSLLWHHHLKAWILQCSAFLMVQLSPPYMTTGKTIALTIWTFFGKVMSLLFNTLLAFLPRSKFYKSLWRTTAPLGSPLTVPTPDIIPAKSAELLSENDVVCVCVGVGGG